MSFFISPDSIPASAIVGHYNPYLVAVSYVIAVVAAYVSLIILRSDQRYGKHVGKKNITLAALVMGTGIWSMHFTGMLAYDLGMEHTYDPMKTGLSMVIAAGFSWAVFYNISRPKLTSKRLFLSAPLMGVGVAAMHYTGMAAMQMKGEIHYLPHLFWASIAIAVAASAAAMMIIRAVSMAKRHILALKTGIALVLGAAVCGMHYTGMAAAVFIPYADCRVGVEQSHAVLSIFIVVATFFVIFLGLFLVDYGRIGSGKLNLWGSTLFICLLCASIVFYVTISSESAYHLAKKQYQKQAHSDSVGLVNNIENSYLQIYQGLRTIAQLQSVRSIDRHATTLHENDRLSIQEMYDNLNNGVGLSEVYILPLEFDPDAIDPVTGKPEEPVIRFESNIQEKVGGASESKEAVEEVEIFEYRQMKAQLEWFEKNYPHRSKISKMDFPAISSSEIITCDNTRYDPDNPNDRDRSGFVYSVPFYDMSGELKGMISGIKLTNSLKDLLPKPYYALINPAQGYVILPQSDGQAHISEKFIKEGKADPSLIYSELIPLAVPDYSGQWLLWVGLPNYLFEGSEEIQNINSQKIFGYLAALALGFIWAAFFILMRRSYLVETRRLTKAKELAERADRAKSDFLANMTHELRTPLNSIIGMSNLLAERGLEKEEQSMLNVVLQSSHILLSHVNDILDISKIEAGETKLEQIGFDFRDVMEKIEVTSRVLAFQKKLAFECNIESGIPFLVGDPFRLGQIITNLITNAIKYTEEGSVKTNFYCTATSDGRVILHGRVIDTGIGIPEEKLRNIFSKFSQVDASNARRHGGTGLGLAITKELTQLMGGEIVVESYVGKGTLFWFNIPFSVTNSIADSDARAGLRRKHKSDGTLPPSEAKILVAEDHPLNQEYIKLFLSKLGFKDADLVGDGKAVLHAIESKDYDLVLMDCFMPELNGYDTTRAIRQKEQGTGRHLPIVALTANAIVGEDEKCRAAGMDDYIPKPVSEKVFVDVLSRWIRFPETVYMNKVEKAEKRKALPVDLETLRTFTSGNVEIEKKLIGIFLSESAKNISIMENNCQDGYSSEWVEAAHLLKGGAAGVGAESLRSLSAVAQSMEDVPSMERMSILAKIIAEFEVVKKWLEEN